MAGIPARTTDHHLDDHLFKPGAKALIRRIFKLATVGHFPAIDVLESISRGAGAVVPPPQMADAREVRRLMGALSPDQAES